MSKIQRITMMAMFVALSVVIHMVEASIPLPIVVPGFKLGLANLVGLIAWQMFDYKMMIWVNGLRIVFASLLSGTIFNVGFYLSISGCILSLIAMYIAKRYTKMSIYGISVAGSCFHNVGQVIAVCLIYEQIFMQVFLPPLILLSIPTGLLLAFLSKQVIRRLKGGNEDVNICL